MFGDGITAYEGVDDQRKMIPLGLRYPVVLRYLDGESSLKSITGKMSLKFSSISCLIHERSMPLIIQ